MDKTTCYNKTSGWYYYHGNFKPFGFAAPWRLITDNNVKRLQTIVLQIQKNNSIWKYYEAKNAKFVKKRNKNCYYKTLEEFQRGYPSSSQREHELQLRNIFSVRNRGSNYNISNFTYPPQSPRFSFFTPASDSVPSFYHIINQLIFLQCSRSQIRTLLLQHKSGQLSEDPKPSPRKKSK